MKYFRIVAALILTLLVIAAARYFGPNRRYTVETNLKGTELSHRAPRGHIGPGPAELSVWVQGPGAAEGGGLTMELVGGVEGSDLRDRFGPARTEPGPDGVGRTWVFQVPEKPLTTRYLYRFEATLGKEPGAPRAILAREDGSPMMVKFKGPVPAGIVVFHVLGMFGGFFLLMLSLFHSVNLASGRGSPEKAARTAWGAWILMFIGGVPLGFAMNYYAFGVMWEAFPFGKDVTDNKTQIALILWGLAALILSRKGGRKAGLVGITAGLAVLAVFLIPHSL